ncbi:MAG: hypothetical protein IJX77_07765, partial [Ruminococcus sp.]|nr:hypothetical protein [Ruminococcus sp.]
LSNKDMTRTENAVITLSGTDTDYQSAVVYAVTQDSSDIRIIDVQNDIENNTVTIELPPLSVAQVVIADTPSDEKVYEAPDIEIKTETYNYNDLETSVNGYKMIPLGDVEHLTKIVVNTTTNCTSGASWYGGGGALTFNNLILGDGTSVWGAKSFSYSAGTADCTVTLDGYFTDGDLNEMSAEIGDTYSELQHWWTSSSNDETGADVTVAFNTITLYYEYDNTSSDEPATDPPTTTEAPDDDILYGDADLSGDVNINDAVKIMSYVTDSAKYPMTEAEINSADVYQRGDGLSNMDALAVQKKLAQLINDLPETLM